MPAPLTQPGFSPRMTSPAHRAGTVDPDDRLYAVVKAYNTRKVGREYHPALTDTLFDAVKQFNARRSM